MLNCGKENIMSESSRLLITAGCSFTSDLDINIDNGIMHWGHIVSHEMGLDLVNIGKIGASNSYIENAVTDAIIEYHHRDPLIMVLWSEPKRVNINDCSTFFNSVDANWLTDDNNYTIKQTDWKIDPHDWHYKSVRASLRCIWRIQQLAKQYNLRIINALGCWTVPGYKDRKNYQKTLLKIQEDWYYNELGINMREMENGVLEICTNHFIEGDSHPNQEGHNIIAEMFMKKYDKLIEEKEFIYD